MKHFLLKCFKDILTRRTNNLVHFSVGKACFLQLEDLQETKIRKKTQMGGSSLRNSSEEKARRTPSIYLSFQPSSVLGRGVEPAHYITCVSPGTGLLFSFHLFIYWLSPELFFFFLTDCMAVVVLSVWIACPSISGYCDFFVQHITLQVSEKEEQDFLILSA